MTFDTWYQCAAEEYSEGLDKHYRWGQHLFNYLAAYDSALANSVPHDADPFYNDEVIPAFVEWVSRHWDEDGFPPFTGTLERAIIHT